MGQRYVRSRSVLTVHVLMVLLAVQPREDIEITLPDGAKRKGKSWETSPMDVAKEISKGLADRIVIAKVSFVQMVPRKEMLV